MAITIGEFYNHITKHMSAEEALKLLLSSSLVTYEKLKFDKDDMPVHPLFIMSMAALDLGWGMIFSRPEDGESIEGISFGNSNYLNQLFQEVKDGDTGS